jgi:hypothetical protein
MEKELEADIGKLDGGLKCVSLSSERKGLCQRLFGIHLPARRWSMVVAKVVDD